jgi:transketolase
VLKWERSSKKLENKVSAAAENQKIIMEDPRKMVSDALVELGAANSNIIYVSCDSSQGASGGEFNKRYPDRHFEFGIAEQNAMGEAAGFALCGKIPFISAYVPFITMRCFEQVRDDVCKPKLNVKIMGNNCGFSVSALGPTHTVLEDISVIRSLPNITIISPCDGPEYSQAIIAAAEHDGPVYLRMHRMKTARVHSGDFKFAIGKGEIMLEGSDITIAACSSMLQKTLDAAKILAGKGIKAEVLNVSTIKPIDRELILKSSVKTKKVVSVEEHSVVNGFGSAVADVLIRDNPVKMKMIGIEDVFATVGDYNEMLEYYGLSAAKIAASVEDFVLNKT